MTDETITTVTRASSDASPAELVAAWLAADLRATVTVVDADAVELRGPSGELAGQVRILLDETRFLGWHVGLS